MSNVILYDFQGLYTFNKFSITKILILIKAFTLTEIAQLTYLININFVVIKFWKLVTVGCYIRLLNMDMATWIWQSGSNLDQF